ncbi:MAG: hypothetical protein V4633_24610 [Pseudomonadota bacterium]
MAKQAVIREVKSMMMSCDPVGNALLTKFLFANNKHACVILPAHIVFWLLQHFPVNQDPALQPPPVLPQIFAEDWDERYSPRVITVQCKQFHDAIRMTLELEDGSAETLLMNRSNVELMRQIMENYRPSLMDLGVF